MSSSFTSDLDAMALEQMGTSRFGGPWIFKKDYRETATRHLIQMAKLSGIQASKTAGDMHALVSNLENKHGTSLAEMLAASENAIWHDPSSKPQTEEERKVASYPLALLSKLDMCSRMTGALYTFLCDYPDQESLNRHVLPASRLNSVRRRLTRPSLVHALKKGLGIGLAEGHDSLTHAQGLWEQQREALSLSLIRDPSVQTLFAKGGVQLEKTDDEEWPASADCGIEVSQPIKHARIRLLDKTIDAQSTTSLALRPDTAMEDRPLDTETEIRSVPIYLLGLTAAYARAAENNWYRGISSMESVY